MYVLHPRLVRYFPYMHKTSARGGNPYMAIGGLSQHPLGGMAWWFADCVKSCPTVLVVCGQDGGHPHAFICNRIYECPLIFVSQPQVVMVYFVQDRRVFIIVTCGWDTSDVTCASVKSKGNVSLEVRRFFPCQQHAVCLISNSSCGPWRCWRFASSLCCVAAMVMATGGCDARILSIHTHDASHLNLCHVFCQ